MTTAYRVNEIFWSLQGEGVRAGTANVFLRFSGCNLRCAVDPGPRSPGGFDCDTEFAGSRVYGLDDLLLACNAIWPGDRTGRAVILTGGEPALQVDVDLVRAFKAEGWYVAMETNGSIDVAALDLNWVTCSPKVAEHAVRCLRADELKYVRTAGQALPRPTCDAPFRLLSPAFRGQEVDRDALDWCIDLIRENPTWRLSVQQHKSWGLS